MLKINKYWMITILFLLCFNYQIYPQTQSDYALVKTKFTNSPEIWEINKSLTNNELGVDLFNYPKSGFIAFDVGSSGTLYSTLIAVLDPFWHRIVYADMMKDDIKALGSYGTGTGQFRHPSSIVGHVLSDGSSTLFTTVQYDVYIADTYNDRVHRATYQNVTNNMSFQNVISGNEIIGPIDIAIDNGFTYDQYLDDQIWILNRNGTLVKFTYNGNYVHNIILPQNCIASAIAHPPNVTQWKTIYVSDTANNMIYRYFYYPPSDSYELIDEVQTSYKIIELTIDKRGHVWAMDGHQSTILKYTDDLEPLCKFGSIGTGNNQFLEPTSMTITAGAYNSGDVFITEKWTNTSGMQRYGIGTDILGISVTYDPDWACHNIEYTLADISVTDVNIYNDLGVKVKSLIAPATLTTGYHLHFWDGTDDSMNFVPSGQYTYSIHAISTYSYSGVPTADVIRTGSFYHEAECCIGIRGNVDGDPDEIIDISDQVYMVDYQFRGGPEPECLKEADLNLDGIIDIEDLVMLLDYVFHGGAEPLDCIIGY